MMQQSIITYLFVPATNRRFIDRAVRGELADPDWLIFDFEDAVRDVDDLDNESSLKICARGTLASYLPFPEDVRRRYVLRINAVNTPAFEADVAFLKDTILHPPHAIVLPKVEKPDDVCVLERALPEPCEIIPLIESAAGVKAIDTILQSSPSIKAFCFGHVDYFFEAGRFPIPMSAVESSELEHIVRGLIESARKNGKQYIDAGFYYRGRWDDLRRHCTFLVSVARGEVMLSKLVMHPEQIEHIRSIPPLQPVGDPLDDRSLDAMSPPDIAAYACDVIAAYEQRPDKKSSVCMMGDAIITPQIYLLAKRHVTGV